MNNAWENLNRTWRERLEKLEDAMQAAVQYQDTLQVRGQARPPRKHRCPGFPVHHEWVTLTGLQRSQTSVPVLVSSQFSTSNEESSDIRSVDFLPCFSLHTGHIIYPHRGYRVKPALLSKSLLVRNSKPRLS